MIVARCSKGEHTSKGDAKWFRDILIFGRNGATWVSCESGIKTLSICQKSGDVFSSETVISLADSFHLPKEKTYQYPTAPIFVTPQLVRIAAIVDSTMGSTKAAVCLADQAVMLNSGVPNSDNLTIFLSYQHPIF